MTNLYQSIPKEKISTMPRAVFNGKIVVVESEREAEKACSFLCSQPIVGIDTETRPSFCKGVSHKVALLQISTEKICFLIRLNRIGLCQPIKKLLSNRKTLKVGLSLQDDLRALRHRGEFRTGSFVDIQNLAKQFGIHDMSLLKIYANVFGQKISKAQRLSNWETDILSPGQKLYAATDAWACVNLYREFAKLKENHDYITIYNDDDELQKHNTQA
jgi:ribonuclease D